MNSIYLTEKYNNVSEPSTNTAPALRRRRKARKQPVAETNTAAALRSTTGTETMPKPNSYRRWSEYEQYLLLEGLETYGPRELESITEVVGTRSRDEVKCAIKYWKAQSALHSMTITFNINRKDFNKKTGKGRMRNFKAVDGVELWIEVMLKRLGKTGGKEAFLAVADMVKMIAGFEALPTVEEADGIDFRELYLWLAETLGGQPIRSLTLATSAFLTQCTRNLSKQAADNQWPRTKAALSRIVDNVWCPQNVRSYSKRPPDPSKQPFVDNCMLGLLVTPGINSVGLDKERLLFHQTTCS
ncbi:hypothetical protein LSTR_LSTR009652 [Laodelphax striatellus]|uniref:Myb-like domain-containing protein n=1 Tax=Laodelphax striatellus TaxID=195883 RepID=A0A482WPW4_LAOST|nr:hypothetical protein LSTR_LSTR009652 [Laodelphax striatellus]